MLELSCSGNKTRKEQRFSQKSTFFTWKNENYGDILLHTDLTAIKAADDLLLLFICVFFLSKITNVFHSVLSWAEIWPEGIHEGPPFVYPHAGGGGRRAATTLPTAGSWSGKEPARDWQILRERCQGSLWLSRGPWCLQEHFHVTLVATVNYETHTNLKIN